MLKSFDDLYTQIESLISERVGEGVSIQPRHILTSDARAESSDIAGMVTTIMTDLGEIIESRILSGLKTTAKSPPSATVSVALGKATAGGKLFSLVAATDVIIPLDSTTYVYYIHLYQNSLVVRHDKPADHCTIAKIVVPKPGTTVRIVDDKPTDGFDGWIVSAKDAYFDQDQEFDDDSKEVLRDLFKEVAAETIFGTLTASENLIVTNVLGTVRIDSQAMKFLDGEGKELAYYGADYARIGNIKILFDRIVSQNYVAGSSGFVIKDDGTVEFESGSFRGTIYATGGEIGGWYMHDSTFSSQALEAESEILLDAGNRQIRVGTLDENYFLIDGVNERIRTGNYESGTFGKGWSVDGAGTAEFQNISIRGQITATTFKKEAISAIGGIFICSPASVLDSDMTLTGTTLTAKDASFETNEVIRLKDGLEDEWLLVTDSTNAPTYDVTRDIADTYGAGLNPAWPAGTAVVGQGRTGAGFLSFDSISSNSPYMDVYQREGTAWDDYYLKVRLGNLNSVAGLSGFGLYSENVYLTGTVNATDGTLQNLDITGEILLAGGSIRTSTTVPRLIFDSDGLKYQISTATRKYGQIALGDGSLYGSGVIAYVCSPTMQIPFYVSTEQAVADMHLVNRSVDPSGAAEVGDLAFVDSFLKECRLAGTPGTWRFVGSRLENRTSDPASPEVGQCWFRTNV